MRIVQIVPGTGDAFYCDNCLRDAALFRAFRKLGHDVLLIPLYLPLQIDGDNSVSGAPIFFGGVNVYLQQKSVLFRKTPRWVDRLFDRPRLLRWVSRKSDMTSAKNLGEMTISMLHCEQGRQAKELDRLTKWLSERANKPDIVFLSNALLTGLAKQIRQRLGVPVLCLLQDEDGFLDALGRPYSEQAWGLLRERAEDVDVFIAVSRYYSDVMRRRLGLRGERVRVVYTGIPLGGYDSVESEPEVPTIGFLSRMCSNKGLDVLIEAFVELKKNEKLRDVRLRIAGGKSSCDEAFLKRIRRQIRSNGLVDDVDFLPTFDCDTKLAFLRTLSVLSVPEKQPVAYAVYVLEALGAGVPVVEPASGVFPELLEITSGGALYEPNDARSLAAAMEPLLLDPNYARQLGKQGKAAVFAQFNIDQTAKKMVRICEEVIERHAGGQ
jgi:glycosyltransferase involved in cell wall biosynthesis